MTDERMEEESRPPEGNGQGGESDGTGQAPAMAGKANHDGFLLIALKDYYKMRENFPEQFGNLLAVWTALIRKAGREKGKKAFTLSWGCVAHDAAIAQNTARSCAKKLQKLHMLKVVCNKIQRNEYEPARWTLYPSYWPYDSKSKKPGGYATSEQGGYATSEQGGYATDTDQPLKKLIDTEGFILHPSDIYENEENDFDSFGGRLGAAADEVVSSGSKDNTPPPVKRSLDDARRDAILKTRQHAEAKRAKRGAR